MSAPNPLMGMLTNLMMQKKLMGGASPAASIPRPPMEPGGGIQFPRPPMPGAFSPTNPTAPMQPFNAPMRRSGGSPAGNSNFAALAAQLLNGRQRPRGRTMPIVRPPVM